MTWRTILYHVGDARLFTNGESPPCYYVDKMNKYLTKYLTNSSQFVFSHSEKKASQFHFKSLAGCFHQRQPSRCYFGQCLNSFCTGDVAVFKGSSGCVALDLERPSKSAVFKKFAAIFTLYSPPSILAIPNFQKAVCSQWSQERYGKAITRVLASSSQALQMYLYMVSQMHVQYVHGLH